MASLQESVALLEQELADLEELVAAGEQKEKVTVAHVNRELDNQKQLLHAIDSALTRPSGIDQHIVEAESLLSLLRLSERALKAQPEEEDERMRLILQCQRVEELQVRGFLRQRRLEGRRQLLQSMEAEIAETERRSKEVKTQALDTSEAIRKTLSSLSFKETSSAHMWRFKTGELKRALGPLYDGMTFMLETEIPNVHKMKTTLSTLASENRLLLDRLKFATKYKEKMEMKLNELMRSIQRKYIGETSQDNTANGVKRVLVPHFLPEYSCISDEYTLLAPYGKGERIQSVIENALDFCSFLTATNGRFSEDFLANLRNEDERPAALALLQAEIAALRHALLGVTALIDQMASNARSVARSDQQGDVQAHTTFSMLRFIKTQTFAVSACRLTFWLVEKCAVTGQLFAWTTTAKSGNDEPTVVIQFPLRDALAEAVMSEDGAGSVIGESALEISSARGKKKRTGTSMWAPVFVGGPRGVGGVLEMETSRKDLENSLVTEELFMWGYAKLLLDLVNEERLRCREQFEVRRRDAIVRLLGGISEDTCQDEWGLVKLCTDYLTEMYAAQSVALMIVTDRGEVLRLTCQGDADVIKVVNTQSVAQLNLVNLRPVHVELQEGGIPVPDGVGIYDKTVDISVPQTGEWILHSWPCLSKKTQINFIVQWISKRPLPFEFGGAPDLSFTSGRCLRAVTEGAPGNHAKLMESLISLFAIHVEEFWPSRHRSRPFNLPAAPADNVGKSSKTPLRVALPVLTVVHSS